jgi:uncharacterized membrane protein
MGDRAMNLSPLLNAPLAIQIHAYAAMAAFALGAVQLARVKGTSQHRALGFLWAGLMLIVAVSSFWIHDMRVWGPWSPIHILSIVALVMLPLGLYFAHIHRIRGHWMTMTGLFLGALVIAGLFTFMPGRIMHKVVFGG